jgi:hypothetical protein
MKKFNRVKEKIKRKFTEKKAASTVPEVMVLALVGIILGVIFFVAMKEIFQVDLLAMMKSALEKIFSFM